MYDWVYTPVSFAMPNKNLYENLLKLTLMFIGISRRLSEMGAVTDWFNSQT